MSAEDDLSRVRAGMEIAAWSCPPETWQRFLRQQRARRERVQQRWFQRIGWVLGGGAAATGLGALFGGGEVAMAVAVVVGVFGVAIPFAIAVAGASDRGAKRASDVTFTATGVVFAGRARLYRDRTYRLSRANLVEGDPGWIFLEFTTPEGAPVDWWEVPFPSGMEKDAAELAGLLAHKASLSENQGE